jgi:hypothetical protein
MVKDGKYDLRRLKDMVGNGKHLNTLQRLVAPPQRARQLTTMGGERCGEN